MNPEDLITFRGILPIPVGTRDFKKRRAEVTIRFFELDTREVLLEERDRRRTRWWWAEPEATRVLKLPRHTLYCERMTMFSFRVDEDDAEETRRWAERLGMDRSELLRDALHRYLVRLRAEEDVEAWIRKPLDTEEKSLAAISGWGPAEDWADWADEAR